MRVWIEYADNDSTDYYLHLDEPTSYRWSFKDAGWSSEKKSKHVYVEAFLIWQAFGIKKPKMKRGWLAEIDLSRSSTRLVCFWEPIENA